MKHIYRWIAKKAYRYGMDHNSMRAFSVWIWAASHVHPENFQDPSGLNSYQVTAMRDDGSQV